MFKKLLSNLPFNPSLINQVAFYAKRVHRESSVRKTGLIILVLAMVVQLFAILSPPQASMATSNNDLIDGGFSSRDQAVLHCLDSHIDFNKILAHYGITCSDVAVASDVTLHSTDYNRNLYSMGRINYPIAGEQPVTIADTNNGTDTLWLRFLWGWDKSGTVSTYRALSGTTKFGLRFFILYNCGNLVFVGIPNPPQICAFNPNILASDTKCFEPCPISGKQNLPKTSPQCFEPCPYNHSIPANSPQCFQPCKYDSQISAGSPKCFEPCKYDSRIPTTSPNCKPCKDAQTRDDKTACLELHKTATNVTEHINDANNTTAKPGDIIKYTLSVTNKGKATVPKFVIQESISDILDYATVVDLQGGKLDKYGMVVWPAQDIATKQVVKKVITVKIKNPLPATPRSSSDPGHFDMIMTNVYGDSVTIKLPPPITKQTEITVQTLPNTGPGTSLVVGFGVTVIVGYFFARSRLMAKELDVVRTDFTTSGGY